MLFPENVLAEIQPWISSNKEKQYLKNMEFVSKVTGSNIDLEARLFYLEESDEFIAIIRDITELREKRKK
ncbi:MAG: hypothetical protein IPN18_16980 [Ignavibacteriales bacterium]|nr:hypothetical protein [Ignavibacteriales bacterium]